MIEMKLATVKGGAFLTSYKGWKLLKQVYIHKSVLAFLTSYKGWKLGEIEPLKPVFIAFSNFL